MNSNGVNTRIKVPSTVMDVFELHRHMISDYAAYTKSFIRIADARIRQRVEQEIAKGLLWPEPLLQLNPAFQPGVSIPELVAEGVLHEECDRIFRIKEHDNDFGKPLRLHLHQEQAIRIAARGQPYVLTTGTGSGKSLAYIIPAVDYVLKNGTGRGLRAIVVYPMNALANSQREELDKFLRRGYEGGNPPVSYARYTGQESEQERERILKNPPDILLTNYVMLELILTRVDERPLVQNAGNLRFLVFDELHTYRGRQGADVAMLIRRCREAFGSSFMRCVGTSATMASEGTTTDQRLVVADVASRIFGEQVSPECVVGETLRRVTREVDFEDTHVKQRLVETISQDTEPPQSFDALSTDPLAVWIEETFGIRREDETGQLVRQTPRAVTGPDGAAQELATLTNTTADQAQRAIERYLFAGSQCNYPETGFPVFAFRLHQFITRGDTVWASLEAEDRREITLRGQQFVPRDRNRILLPLVFCRSCGQAYYRVDRPRSGQTAPVVPRTDFGITIDDNMESGYLYLSEKAPWTGELDDILRRVPDEWIEFHRGQPRIKRNQPVPEVMVLRPDGMPDASGTRVAFVPAPFRFCLNPDCRVAYNARQRSDVLKLATIGVDGRSTATTVLALATILKLRVDQSLEPEARKLLSFTDNRQDASLQAGHFNDFVEVGLIRSALYRAMSRFGEIGLRYDELVHHVDRALNLPVDFYANDPELRGPALEETRRALRSVLAYYLYRDLERGWRVTSPNLEQCGLLQFEYLGLEEIAKNQQFWQEHNAHGALIAASPEQRANVIRVLLDHLRRSLAIKEDSLTPNYQDRISEQSRQRLRDPWVIEDSREMVRAGVAWPRSRMDREQIEEVYVSPQSNFGLFLRRPGVLADFGDRLTLDDTGQIILDLFRCLRPWGLVEEVRSPRQGSQVPGYQIPASIMVWRAGDGSRPMVDPLRVTREAELDNEANQYFVQLYKTFADLGAGLEAREHTAQVHAEDRVERESRFRTGDLPILFCSPTMELGVDIAQLNVVNMRNVPPTPANYAQRSGRAGRSGQPALVYTYCSGFSPHDQYYFRYPDRMVSGTVTAPRLDLLNRDLIKAHVHAVWLAESGLKLGQTLTDILEVGEDNLALPLKQEVIEKLNDASTRLRALQRCRHLLESIGPQLEAASWYRSEWLNDVLSRLPNSFDEACNRWRSLYRAAVQQRQLQNRIIGDHSRSQADRDRAKRLRAQAESQIALLTDPQNAFEGDFYSYRYFASEGFLPGYNFPRLPLSAFIPARRGRRGRDEFLSRPRFLAISEFGPRAMVYHEGARYRIHKVNLAFDEDSNDLTQFTMKLCSNCGYGHLLVTEELGPDNCENCRQPLFPTDEVRDMVRLQNVTAKRADRITSDEEERQRIGYEILSTFRFAEVDGQRDVIQADVMVNESKLATLRYGDAATIWRVNLGWKKRRNPNERGFLLDVERGFWASNRDADESDDEEPLSPRIRRVVPYVEDRRNALTIAFEVQHNLTIMASLQSALKQGIRQIYQLEPDELAADPLPSFDDRKLLFFYEATEGGAGVLRQLLEDPIAIATVASAAIELCHFDPDTGEDLAADPASRIDCEAACYDCLLEYGNQPDHRNIDRKAVLPVLQDLARATTQVSVGPRPRVDHLDELMRQCDSNLERRWLQLVHDSHLKLPSHAQHLIAECQTRPDFFYQDENTTIYIDGPVHDQPEQKTEDEQITERLTSAGYLVIRFHHAANWTAILDQYPDIFGKRKS